MRTNSCARVCIRTYTWSAQVGHRVHAGGCKRGCACARMHARLCACACVCERPSAQCFCFAQYTHWTQPSSRAQALRVGRSRPCRQPPSHSPAASRVPTVSAAVGRPRPHCTALHCTALHCTALHCTALHCTAVDLGCISPQCNMGPPLRRSSRVLAAPQSSASLPVPPIPTVGCWIWMLVRSCSVHAMCTRAVAAARAHNRMWT